MSETSRSPAIKFKTSLVPSNNAIATRMGVDLVMVSTFPAEHCKDRRQINASRKNRSRCGHQQGLAALLPSLLQSLSGNLPATSPLEHSGVKICGTSYKGVCQSLVTWLRCRRGEHLYNERISKAAN
jgi:hypothetical protein